MKHYLIGLMFIMCSFETRADWYQCPESTKTLFVASQVAITADWITTRNAFKDGGVACSCYETNRFLGQKPSVESIDMYFIGNLALNYFLTDYISKSSYRPYTNFYLGLRTFVHSRAAINNQNISVGVKINF